MPYWENKYMDYKSAGAVLEGHVSEGHLSEGHLLEGAFLPPLMASSWDLLKLPILILSRLSLFSLFFFMISNAFINLKSNKNF